MLLLTVIREPRSFCCVILKITFESSSNNSHYIKKLTKGLLIVLFLNITLLNLVIPIGN